LADRHGEDTDKLPGFSFGRARGRRWCSIDAHDESCGDGGME
jgi:hypothetical protein